MTWPPLRVRRRWTACRRRRRTCLTPCLTRGYLRRRCLLRSTATEDRTTRQRRGEASSVNRRLAAAQTCSERRGIQDKVDVTDDVDDSDMEVDRLTLQQRRTLSMKQTGKAKKKKSA
ncbi:uncharacterized protein LOC144984558 [Oryzias latipes]